MRQPARPECLYVDFDGFFASCEEQADPRLHGCPVGVIPFPDARNSCVIAANPKAKGGSSGKWGGAASQRQAMETAALCKPWKNK